MIKDLSTFSSIFYCSLRDSVPSIIKLIEQSFMLEIYDANLLCFAYILLPFLLSLINIHIKYKHRRPSSFFTFSINSPQDYRKKRLRRLALGIRRELKIGS